MIYDSYAPFYDASGQVRFAMLTAQYLGEILQRHPLDGQQVLDVACGIGTQALGLAQAGYIVTGSDSSAASVARAQHEATETAQALRYLASRDLGREQVDPSIAGTSQTGGRRSRDRGRPPRTVQGSLPTRRYGLQLRRFLHMPQKPFDKVGDAVLWIVLAAAIRVGARFLLAMVPALTPVFVLLMFAPAALAVYLAMFVPRAGFVSIYRLFLIMLGLLLGGRL